MSVMKFSDGVTMNTDGEYRVVREADGFYVVGQGMMCAVETRKEGVELIAVLTPPPPPRCAECGCDRVEVRRCAGDMAIDPNIAFCCEVL